MFGFKVVINSTSFLDALIIFLDNPDKIDIFEQSQKTDDDFTYKDNSILETYFASCLCVGIVEKI